jgi:hypothetical protein
MSSDQQVQLPKKRKALRLAVSGQSDDGVQAQAVAVSPSVVLPDTPVRLGPFVSEVEESTVDKLMGGILQGLVGISRELAVHVKSILEKDGYVLNLDTLKISRAEYCQGKLH